MPRQNSLKRRRAKTILRLPDLEQSRNAVLHSLAATSSQESYGHAIDEFIGWYCSEPRLAFNRTKPNCCPSLPVFPPTEEPHTLHHQRAEKEKRAISAKSSGASATVRTPERMAVLLTAHK